MSSLKQIAEECEVEEIKINCTGEKYVNWRDLEDLQLLEDGRSLKDTSPQKINNLAESLIRFGLVSNLQVWKNEDKLYCFDAHHRKKAFKLLEENDIVVPNLPVTFCLAKTKTEAKKFLIVKESKSSWININAIEDYIEEVGISVDVASTTIDIPDFEFGVTREKDDVFLDDDFELPSGDIKEKDTMVKLSLFTSVKIKKDILKQLRDIEKNYGSELVKVIS